MKTIRLLLFSAAITAGINATSQTTAMDFTLNDCNGTPQHLFTDLDAGQAVIIEYFMTSCGSCVVAGDALEDMKTNLLAEFPNQTRVRHNAQWSERCVCDEAQPEWIEPHLFNLHRRAQPGRQGLGDCRGQSWQHLLHG